MKEQIKYFIEDIQYLGLANIFVILGMGVFELLFIGIVWKTLMMAFM